VVVEENVSMRTRDGVTLIADVFRPDAPGRFPTLVMRTPYSRRSKGELSQSTEVQYYPKHGYVVVIQDVRGRGESAGDFYAFVNEGPDTYDTIEWAAALPWSNGNVGTIGQSYLASVQYPVAPLRPPSLKAMSPVAGATNHFHNSTFRRGVFEMRWRLAYFLAMERVSYVRAGTYRENRERLDSYAVAPRSPLSFLTDESYRHLPIKDWGERLAGVEPYVRDFLSHSNDGPFWQDNETQRMADEIETPTLYVSSWYDAFISDTLAMFTAVSERGRTDSARQQQRLLIGPWAHLRPYSEPTTGGCGDIDFGPAASIELDEIQRRWFDHHLGDDDNGVDTDPPVRIFVMGVNTWRDEQEWPLARTRYTPLYLHSAADARQGNGTLSFDVPASEPSDTFDFDPEHPVPTLGGTIIGEGDGVRDQRSLAQRDDMLVYRGPVLDEPLEITGPVTMVLHISSSAPDTDFTATLIDEHPDGFARNLVDGIVRARFRDSLTEPTLMVPGQDYALPIDLWATSHVFLPGHRIRLHVSSSNFPRYDRNANSGHTFGEDTELHIAHQTVHHDAARPSHVLLPVIPLTTEQ
jgi:putative CocE/NonD family hydrolase